jgi:hypothetical protein
MMCVPMHGHERARAPCIAAMKSARPTATASGWMSSFTSLA